MDIQTERLCLSLPRPQDWSGLWTMLGYGYWMVRERSTGQFVGEVGLADFRRQLEPGLEGMAEAGWALRPEYQGRGLAREAVGAALDWFSKRFPQQPVVCLIHPDNQASLKLARRCGFQPWCQTTYQGHPTLLHLWRREDEPS